MSKNKPDSLWKVELAAMTILAISSVVRLFPLIFFDFPINDGGMFYAMTRQLIENNFMLPELLTYNHLNLPFAYPPLGFYLTALIFKITSWNLVDLFRFLPGIWLMITVGLFYGLASEFLNNRIKALFSTLIYAITPAAFFSIQAGGGITRGAGMAFTLAGLIYFIKYAKTRKSYIMYIIGGFWGLSFMSHLEMVLFLSLGIGLLTIYYKLDWKTLVKIGIVGGLVSLPWWMTVVRRYGGQIILAVWDSNLAMHGNWLKLWLVDFTKEKVINFAGVTFMLGTIYLLSKKAYFLPLWTVMIFLIFRRGPELFSLIPVALICGEVLGEMYRTVTKEGWVFPAVGVSAVWLSAILVGTILVNPKQPDAWKEPVSPADRKAFSWIKDHTESKAKFLILTGTAGTNWASDGVSEWFPALTDREAINTIQGTEWKIDEPLTRFKKNQAVYECLKKDLKCINKLGKDNQLEMEFDYLYITKKETCPDSECVIFPDYHDLTIPSFKPVFEENGVGIWKRI